MLEGIWSNKGTVFSGVITVDDVIVDQKINIELLDLDTDETAVSQSVKEAVSNVLEDEETPFNTFDPNEEKQGIEGIDY